MIVDDYCELVITRRNGDKYTVLYDKQDRALLLEHKWTVLVREHTCYVRRNSDNALLHRLLVGVEGMEVDHLNRNGLDNRRSNLRVATHAQNQQNAAAPGTSEFKGVQWDPSRQRWRVRIRGVRKGSFVSEIDAAKAYDAAAREMYGDFAYLNFP